MQALSEGERRVGQALVGYQARDVVKGFRVELLVVHFCQLTDAVVQLSGAFATMLAVSTFTDTIADAVTRRIGGGTVGPGEGMCDLCGSVMGDDEGLGCESAL